MKKFLFFTVFLFVIHTACFAFTEGPYTATKEPWSGWWWPMGANHDGQKLYDDKRPMELYDMFIHGGIPSDPNIGAKAWERQECTDTGGNCNTGHRARDDNNGTAGHCGAWSIASILEDEPKYGTSIGILPDGRFLNFSVGDLKGLLVEKYLGGSYEKI